MNLFSVHDTCSSFLFLWIELLIIIIEIYFVSFYLAWLEDAALFAAIDHNVNAFSWNEWPDPLKNRHLGALEDVYRKHEDFVSTLWFYSQLKTTKINFPLCHLRSMFFIMQIDIFVAQQFLFQRQWQKVRQHARKLGIKIIGDMPIYVGYHSADVWANRKSFLLVCSINMVKWSDWLRCSSLLLIFSLLQDRSGFPILVSGVPPDAFSETGQLWGRLIFHDRLILSIFISSQSSSWLLW